MTQLDGGNDRTGTQHYRANNAADGQRPRSPVGGGTPEGRFLASSGKVLNWQITELKERRGAVRVRAKGAEAAVQNASSLAGERQMKHRGGDRPWLLRSIIPVATAVEVLTGFVAMEELVSSVALAAALAVMAALVGAGTACIIANRRLNRLPVSASARILEGIFVGVLTLLRFESLDVQNADFAASLGGAALAALISAIALLAIEEVVVETDTFDVFLSRMRVWYWRWQCAQAASRLARFQARVEAAGEKFQHAFPRLSAQGRGTFPGRGAAARRSAESRAFQGDRRRTMKRSLTVAVGAAFLAAGCSPLSQVISMQAHPVATCGRSQGVVLIAGAHRMLQHRPWIHGWPAR